MSREQFERLSQLVRQRCGIKLPPAKKTMLEARLAKRVRRLNLSGFDEYCSLIFDQGGLEEELTELLDVVTTNTTEFFREPKHYDVLCQAVLPQWLKATRGLRPLDIWSAGCSTGEEPYTLAMVLSEFDRCRIGAKPLEYSILATDVCISVLRHAINAVYSEDRAAKLPAAVKKRYFLRSKDRTQPQVRLAPAIRERVSFKHLNFMDSFDLGREMDVIFCRNVLIYFERNVQEAIVAKLCSHLRPDGVLFTGHSESLTGMQLPLTPLAPTVYRRR